MTMPTRKNWPGRSCAASANISSSIRRGRNPSSRSSAKNASEQLDFALGHFLDGQFAFSHQLFVALDPVAAVALGVIKRFIGPVDGISRRVVGEQRAEADADGDMADAAEYLRFNRLAESLQRGDGKFLSGRLQQRDKLFTAETEELVVEAEGEAHRLGKHDQDFVADQMSKVVVNPLEVVNVADCQPVGTFRIAVAPTGRTVRVTLEVNGCGTAEQFEQVLVEGLATGQSGQRVGFAIIEQRDVVAEIFDQAHQRDALV